MEIKYLDLTRLRVNECFGFLKKVESSLKLLNLESEKDIINNFKNTLKEFDLALNQTIKNSHTTLVNEANEKTKRTWRHFKAHTKAFCNYPEVQHANIAAKTYEIFEKYGDIANINYTEAYGKLYNILQELEAISLDDRTLIQTHLYTENLKRCYNEFLEIQSKQLDESSYYKKGFVATSFENSRMAYYDLVKRINALVVIDGEDAFRDFVAEMAVIIEHELHSIATKQADRESKRKN